MKGAYLSITGFMKTGLLKKYQLLPLIGYLRVPLLQKQNLAMKSSSCKRDGGSQLVRPSAVKRPKFKLSAVEKDIYILYNWMLMLTLKMFQGDRLLALKEHLILYDWKNHLPCCQKNSL